MNPAVRINLAAISQSRLQPTTAGLVIFDCDGVLVDSELLSCDITAKTLQNLGCQISAAEVQAEFLGMSGSSLRQAIVERFGITFPRNFDDQLCENVMQVLRTNLAPIEGAGAFLEELVIPKCVASSSPPARIALSLEITGLAPYFGADLFSATMVSRGKPFPDLFLLASTAMKVAPERTIVIEDSAAGVAAAVAAGMLAMGFAAGSHCGKDHQRMLIEAGAVRVAQNYDELRQVILEL